MLVGQITVNTVYRLLLLHLSAGTNGGRQGGREGGAESREGGGREGVGPSCDGGRCQDLCAALHRVSLSLPVLFRY